MAQAKDVLEQVVKRIKFSDSKIPIVSNVTAGAHIKGQEIGENLIKQLTFPVLWKGCIEYLINKRAETFFEVGPSKVLRGLIRKINPQTQVVNIEKKEDLDKIEPALK
jgi:[acyl-carrier-protein] S-malonyltransferase